MKYWKLNTSICQHQIHVHIYCGCSDVILEFAWQWYCRKISYNRARYLKNRHDNNQYMYVYLCAAWNIDRGLWIWYSPKRRHKSFLCERKLLSNIFLSHYWITCFSLQNRQNINKKEVLLNSFRQDTSGFWSIFFWINTHFILWMDRPRKNYRLI